MLQWQSTNPWTYEQHKWDLMGGEIKEDTKLDG